jgi:hypothetical protein
MVNVRGPSVVIAVSMMVPMVRWPMTITRRMPTVMTGGEGRLARKTCDDQNG